MSASNPAFEFQDFGNYSLLVLLPPLNDEWSQVEEYAKELLSKVGGSESPRLVLDLNSLDYCGSAVVALMVRIWKNVQERKGAMQVSCSSEMVRQVLATARLTDLWVLHDRREDAERALGVRKDGSTLSPSRRAGALLFVLALFYGGAATAGGPEELKFLPIASAIAGGIFLVLALGAFAESRGLTVLSRFAVALIFGVSLVTIGMVAGKVSLADATLAQKALGGAAVVLGLVVYWFAWTTLDHLVRSSVNRARIPATADAAPQDSDTPSSTAGAASSSNQGATQGG